MLDALPTGEQCKDLGQERVAEAVAADEAAKAAETAAKEALDAATGATVQLDPQPYSLLATDECDWIKTDPNYIKAEEHFNQCTTDYDEAKGAAIAAAEELEAAKEEAAQ